MSESQSNSATLNEKRHHPHHDHHHGSAEEGQETKKKIHQSNSTTDKHHNETGSTTQKTKDIFLITGNKNKLIEFQHILENTHINLSSANIDLPELQGDAISIAKEKALIAFKEAKRPVITEDTSLCFNAYNGLPGPYIKWFLQELKPEGLIKMLAQFEDKSGYAQCIITYMNEDLKEPICFIGKTPGTIVEPKGPQTFGWDCVFQPAGYDLTYAELSKEEKSKISHRFRAIEKMIEYFKE